MFRQLLIVTELNPVTKYVTSRSAPPSSIKVHNREVHRRVFLQGSLQRDCQLDVLRPAILAYRGLICCKPIIRFNRSLRGGSDPGRRWFEQLFLVPFSDIPSQPQESPSFPSASYLRSVVEEAPIANQLDLEGSTIIVSVPSASSWELSACPEDLGRNPYRVPPVYSPLVTASRIPNPLPT